MALASEGLGWYNLLLAQQHRLKEMTGESEVLARAKSRPFGLDSWLLYSNGGIK